MRRRSASPSSFLCLERSLYTVGHFALFCWIQSKSRRDCFQKLRVLRASGSNIYDVSFDSTGLKLALALDNAVYYANIRPEYYVMAFRLQFVTIIRLCLIFVNHTKLSPAFRFHGPTYFDWDMFFSHQNILCDELCKTFMCIELKYFVLSHSLDRPFRLLYKINIDSLNMNAQMIQEFVFSGATADRVSCICTKKRA